MTRHDPHPVRSSFAYRMDEAMISQSLGVELAHPIRVFTLPGIGIDQERLVRFLLPVFSTLHMDSYDGKRNKVAFLKTRFPQDASRLDAFLPQYYSGRLDLEALLDIIERLQPADRHEFDRIGMTARRKRAVAKFMVTAQGPGWHIERIPMAAFQQAVAADDLRALERKFQDIPVLVSEHPDVQQLIGGIAHMVRDVRDTVRTLEITMHLMFVFADALFEGDNAPEGIHRDGADYIVSALVIERAGILGGESIVYGPDKHTAYLHYTLQVGEGLFQEDGHYWHYVTPIHEDPAVPPAFGNRSIIGFDIKIKA